MSNKNVAIISHVVGHRIFTAVIMVTTLWDSY